MKHGQKAKGKAAKAKASKKSSSAAKTKSKTSQGARRPKEASRGGETSSKAHGRSAIESVTFNNPTIAAAFKRAVKKYPNAFRRLTD